MTTRSAMSPGTLEKAVIAALAEAGSLAVADLRRRLRVRRQRLLRVLPKLVADGVIVKGAKAVEGDDGRLRVSTVYSLAIEGRGGGSCAWDGGSPDQTQRQGKSL